MDHSWGRNVIEYGLGSAGATLAARFAAFPGLILTNGAPEHADRFRIWVPLGDNLAYDYSEFLKSSFPGLSFPYGLDVEPDAPM